MDYTGFLEDFLPTIDNIPGEVQHVMNELLAKDTELHSLLDTIRKLDQNLGKLMKSGPNPSFSLPELPETAEPLEKAKAFAYESVQSVPEQLGIYIEIENLYDQCKDLVSDKVQLVERIKDTLDRHLRKLNTELDR